MVGWGVSLGLSNRCFYRLVMARLPEYNSIGVFLMKVETQLISLLESYFEYLQEEVCLSSCSSNGCSKNCTSEYEKFSKVYNILIKRNQND